VKKGKDNEKCKPDAASYEKNGLLWLSGSQKFRLMRGIQESLAGWVAIIFLT
jgi:hypothetical protein